MSNPMNGEEAFKIYMKAAMTIVAGHGLSIERGSVNVTMIAAMAAGAMALTEALDGAPELIVTNSVIEKYLNGELV